MSQMITMMKKPLKIIGAVFEKIWNIYDVKSLCNMHMGNILTYGHR